MSARWSVLALCLALAPPTLVPVSLAAQEAGRITVEGEGRARVVPDMGRISLGVSEEAATASEALAASSARTAQVLSELEAAGMSPQDVQTSEIQLWPVYPDRQGPGRVKPSGFRAGSTLTVIVRELDRLGEVLDAVVGAGATEIHGLGFDVADPARALDEARAEAVRDARHRAEVYAEAAGVELGPLLSLSDGAAPQPPMPFDGRMMAMDEAMPVAPGTMDLSATVTAVWGFGAE